MLVALCLLVLPLLAAAPADAAAPQSVWVDTLNDANASITSIWVVDGGIAPDGSVYTLANGSGDFQFDSTTFTANGDYGYRLVKQNPDGSLAWAQVPAASPMYVVGMAVASDGGVVISGSAGGGESIAGQTIPGSHACDGPIVKLSATGAFEWMNCDPGIAEAGWLNVGAAPDGSFVTAGTLFDGGPATYGSSVLPARDGTRLYLAGLSASGSYTWALQAESNGTEANSATAYADGSVLVGGYMAGPTATFGPTTLTTSGSATVLARGGPDGWRWATSVEYSGSADFRAYGPQVSIADDDAAYFTDRFTGTATFGSGAGAISITSTGGADAFVAKLNADGTWAWAQAIGGSGEDAGRAVSAVSTTCGVTVAGWFSGTVGMGSTTLTASSAQDVFLANIGEDGTWDWAVGLGSHPAPKTWPDMVVTAAPDGSISASSMLGATPTVYGSLPVASGKASIGSFLRLPCIAPPNVAATAGNGKVTVTWDAVPGQSITTYTVTAGPGGKTCTATAPATTCVIDGLTNGTEYSFTVTADNAAGAGPASDAVVATPTGGSSPKAKPSVRIVSARVVGGSRFVARVRVNRAGAVRVSSVLGGVPGCVARATAKRAGVVTVSCVLGESARARIVAGPVVLRVSARLGAAGAVARDASRVRVAQYAPTPVTG